jgi:hypothetical protein
MAIFLFLDKYLFRGYLCIALRIWLTIPINEMLTLFEYIIFRRSVRLYPPFVHLV